ncbi:hypothetical protein [Streptomyces sp. NPDC003487]
MLLVPVLARTRIRRAVWVSCAVLGLLGAAPGVSGDGCSARLVKR